jgi:hypothetical protein
MANEDLKSGSSDIKKSESKIYPGARTYNPLSVLSSYSYTISLYMVIPEIMSKFIAGGGTMAGISPLDPGIRIVAQSGGINSEIENRLTGPDGLDYYIDDLTIETVLPNSGPSSPSSVNTNIKFKIIEPYGFSFLQDLAVSRQQMMSQSGMSPTDVDYALPAQQYILGIRFHGYDRDGKIVTNADFMDYTGGYTTNTGIIERYIPIIIARSKFRIDGKTVFHNIEANAISEDRAFGSIWATMSQQQTLTGNTVGDILKGKDGLIASLNEIQARRLDAEKIEYKIEYDIQFIDENGKIDNDSPIARALLQDQVTTTSEDMSLSYAKDSKKVTIKDSLNSVAATNKHSFGVVAGQHVSQVITDIIKRSTYITDALSSKILPDLESTTVDSPTSKTVRWFNINPSVQIINWDKKLADWVCKITYQIRPYDVPFIPGVYNNKLSRFPGVYKSYDYWMTGTNSEIISYSQEYNNLYYMPIPENGGPQTSGSYPTTTKAIVNSGGSASPTGAGQNNSGQIADNLKTNLDSMSDHAIATINIIGDPDYIMTSVGVNNVGISQYYGKDQSINPTSGQVFAKINFRTAKDYDSDGLLKSTGPINFYNIGSMLEAGIEGMLYMIIKVVNSFSKGSFTQKLSLVIVPEDQIDRQETTKAKPDSGREDAVKSLPPAPTPRPSIPSVDLRTPQSSLGKGVQSLLNKPTKIENPSVTDIQNSDVYKKLRLANVGGREAYNRAKESLITGVVDDQVVGNGSKPSTETQRGK